MAFFSWCKLLILEQKLKSFLGGFGKYNKYRRLCLEKKRQDYRGKTPYCHGYSARARHKYSRGPG